MMKRKITLLTVLLCVAAVSLNAQWKEWFRSERNQKPPSGLTAQIDGYMPIKDVNGNGSDDIVYLFSDSVWVKDGLTKDVILQWKVEEGCVIGDKFHSGPPATGYEEIKWTHHIVYTLDKASPKMSIYEINDSGRVDVFENMRFIGLADFNDDGKTDILAYDTENKQSLTMNYSKTGLNIDLVEEDIIVTPSVRAYALSLKFESQTKPKLINRNVIDEDSRKHDFNGDGRAEIVLIIQDSMGIDQGITIRNPSNGAMVWSYAYDQNHIEDMRKGFRGFYDINGDDENELVFGERTIVTLSKEVYSIDDAFNIEMLSDIDNDGYTDAIGRNTRDSTIQIWGKSISTFINEEAKVLQNVQAFPNPFLSQLEIGLIPQSQSNIQFKIYDSTGKHIHIETVVGQRGVRLEHTLTLSSLKVGLYWLNIINGEYSKGLPILKQ